MGRFLEGYSSCKPHTNISEQKKAAERFVKVTEKVAGSDYNYLFPFLKVVLLSSLIENEMLK